MKPRNFFRFLLDRAKAFGCQEDGLTLPMLAVSLVAITGLVGLAIDTARMQLVQSKLQFSLDAAGLAGGSTASTADLTTEVNKYLKVNFNNYLGSTLTGVAIAPNATTTTIALSATATLPTTFLQVVGLKTITVTANSQISRQITGLEVTLVIDISYGDDLTDFKNGLMGFVQTLFNSAAGVSNNLYVSIVPFNQSVNIGTWNASWLDPTSNAKILAQNPAGWGPGQSWGGCVMARSGNEATSDDPPTTGNTLLEEDYFPSDTAATVQNKLQISAAQANADFQNYQQWPTLNNAQQTDSELSWAFALDFGLNLWQGVVRINGVPTQYYTPTLNTVNQGPNFMCPPPIVPLTNNEQTVLDSINSVSVIQGDWLPDMGLEWGWNTLSPRWQGLWTGAANASLPMPYNTPGWNKAVVWVEGIAYASIPNGNVIDDHIYGGYGFLSQGMLGTTDQDTAINTILDRTQSVCNSMLANNVYIYVLGYSANNSYGGLMPVMQNCATGQNYTFWFGPGDWGAFDNALNSIADSLHNLWLSK